MFDSGLGNLIHFWTKLSCYIMMDTVLTQPRLKVVKKKCAFIVSEDGEDSVTSMVFIVNDELK